jgi:hypothetical protein
MLAKVKKRVKPLRTRRARRKKKKKLCALCGKQGKTIPKTFEVYWLFLKKSESGEKTSKVRHSPFSAFSL